jgi:cell division protein FtsL
VAKKSALDRIDNHEKICRLMQKQTFERIDRMETRIARMEKWLIGGLTAIVLAVLSNHL